MDNLAYVVDCEREFETKSKHGGDMAKAHTFEEAITLARVGIFHYKLLLICGFCFMSVMVEIMGVSQIMQLMKCDLYPTQSEQGILLSAGFLGVVVSSHTMGFLADTWGRVKTLRLALGCSSVCSFLSGFSVNIWMLIVLRFLTGFFISGGQACVFSLCGEFHSNSSRVRHVTLLSCFMPIALMVAPSLAIGILPLQIDAVVLGMRLSSWRVLLMVNVLVSLCALAGLFTLPETPKYQLVQGDPQASLATLRKIFAMNTGEPAENFPVQTIVLQTGGANLASIHGIKDALRLIWQQTVPLFYKERVLHTINICLIQFTVYGISQGLFMWFPSVLNELVTDRGGQVKVCTVLDRMGADFNLSANGNDQCPVEVQNFTYLVLICIGGFFTVIYLIFAYTIDYIGKKNLLIAWMIISMVCLIGVHWINEFILVVIVLTFVMAIGNCGGLVSTIAMDFYPTHINAMGMCFIMMIGRLGAVVGSNLLGSLLFTSCDQVLWGALGLVIALSIMGSFLPDKAPSKIVTNK